MQFIKFMQADGKWVAMRLDNIKSIVETGSKTCDVLLIDGSTVGVKHSFREMTTALEQAGIS